MLTGQCSNSLSTVPLDVPVQFGETKKAPDRIVLMRAMTSIPSKRDRERKRERKRK